MEFERGSGVQFFSNPLGAPGAGGSTSRIASSHLRQAVQGFLAPLSSYGISPSRASPCDLSFSQWWSLGKQVYFPRGVWLPRSRNLRPPRETRLFLEMAPHGFGHIPLFRELTAQTRVETWTPSLKGEWQGRFAESV